jgi:hypothetical protein
MSKRNSELIVHRGRTADDTALSRLPLLCQVRLAICGFQRVHLVTTGATPAMVLIGLLDNGRGGGAGRDGGGDAGSWVM